MKLNVDIIGNKLVNQEGNIIDSKQFEFFHVKPYIDGLATCVKLNSYVYDKEGNILQHRDYCSSLPNY